MKTKHLARKSYNLKKSQQSVFRKFQTNHSTIIKERGKALGMGYINKVLF